MGRIPHVNEKLQLEPLGIGYPLVGMCKKGNLRAELSGLFGLLVIGSFVLIGLGSWMIVDADGRVAYGNQVRNWGGGYVFISILLLVVVGFGLFGSRRHNKFALTASLCCNALATFILFIVVVTIFVQVTPAYSRSVAERCVARGTEAAPISETCMSYYTDKGNIRLFRLWLQNYVRSQTRPKVRAYMLNVEDDNFCCGWGPPVQCANMTGGNYSLNGIELMTSNRPIEEALQRCSNHSGWYQVGLYCRKVDGAGLAGCPYMFSQSSICTSDSTTRGGCAGAFQSILSSQFSGIAGGGVAVLIIQITTILTTCCYCFKRKYTDVLPPYEPFSAKEFEKYRFGVPGHTAPMKVMVPEAQEVKLDDAGQAVVAAGAAEAQPAPGGDVQAGAGTGLSPSKSPVKSP